MPSVQDITDKLISGLIGRPFKGGPAFRYEQPQNVQEGEAPQPQIPYGFSQEDIGKPLFYDQSKGRLVSEFELTPGMAPDRITDRYIPVFYDPFMGSITSERTPVRLRVGMDPTNLDPALEEEASIWKDERSEIRRLAAASEAQYQRNVEWAQGKQRRDYESFIEVDAKLKQLDILNENIRELDQERVQLVGLEYVEATKQFQAMLEERRDLKEDIASNPVILTYTDTEGIARNLELMSPGAKNFGYQLLYGLQRPAIYAKGIIGQEAASEHTAVPFASDIVYMLARGATLGIKWVTSGLPAIGARSKELHRELFTAWTRNHGTVDTPAVGGALGYAWTWFLSRGATVFEYIEDDQKRLRDSVAQAKMSGEEFLRQIETGDVLVGGNYWNMNDLELDRYIADLETGKIQIGPRQEQTIKNAIAEQERRASNENLRVVSEALFQEVFEALEFADANELDMTDEEYNDIYSRSADQVREALDMYTQRSDIPAYWFTYSQRLVDGGDEMWNDYMDAMTTFVLTAHRMPQPWEWEAVANHFTDPAAEFIGEMVFDPINLIPGLLMDEIFDVIKGFAKFGMSGVKYGGKVGATLLPGPARTGMRHVAKWWGAQTIRSMSTTTRFWATESLRMIGRKVTGFDEIMKGVDDGFRGVADMSRGLTPRQTKVLRNLARVFKWKDTDEAITNLQGLFRAGREQAVNARMESIYDDVFEMRRIRVAEGLADDIPIPEGLVKKYADAWAEDWSNISTYVGDIFEDAYIVEKRLSRRLMDEGLLAFAQKRGVTLAAAEALVRLNQIGMTAWKTAVLTLRPGFTVINYMDSMFRAVKYGADPLRRMDEVMKGVFVKLMPEEILTRFAGPDLPGIGKIPEAILAGDVGENLLSLFWAGFKSSDATITTLGINKVADGARAMNAGFEFSLSARLWASEFEKGWNIVEQVSHLRRLALEDNIDEYSSILLREMWNQSGDEAVETVLDRFMRGDGRFVVPQRLYDELSELTGVADSKWYWNKVTSDINILIDEGVPEDELLESINRVLDQRMEEMVSNYEDSMRQMELVQAGGGASILEGDPQDYFDVENYFEPSRRHGDEGIDDGLSYAPEEPTGTVDDVITKVEEGSGRAVDKFRIQEDENVLRGLQEELAAEGIDIKLVSSARSRAGIELASSRASFNTKIEALRQEVDDLTTAIDNLAQATGAADPDETARLLDMQRKLSYLERYDDMMERLYSGSFREFALNVYPGPLNGHLPPALRGARWNQYDLHRAQVFEESTRMFDSKYADVMAGNVDLDSLPTIQETLRQWGVDMEFDQTGDIIGLRFGRVNQQTGEFVIREGGTVTDPKAFFNLQETLNFDPNIHQAGFQDFMEQPFSRNLTRRVPRDAAPLGAWPHPGMQDWWEDLLETGDGMLTQLNIRYRNVLDDSGEPVLRNFQALKMHMLSEARIADGLGRPASAQALRYRHRALVDEYNMAWKMIDPANAPLMPHSGIPDQVPAGMRQWIHVADDGERRLSVIGDMHEALKDDIALRMQGGTWEFAELSADQQKVLVGAAQELSVMQQEAIEAINYGGTFMGHDFGDGAAGLVNKVMIDYAHETNPERWIKKFYPFWKFPSKSLPFWVETMVRNPEIPAFYAKFIQASRRQSYGLGAVNSKGEQLPRLTGYLPMPGREDKWWNPLSSFSFRFVFPRPVPQYDQYADEYPLGNQVADYLFEYGTAFGFSPSPVVTLGLYLTGYVDETKYPKWGLFPQTALVPPFVQRWIGQSLRRSGARNVPDLWQADLPWLDSLIEKQVLITILEELSDPSLTESQRMMLVKEAEAAITHRDLASPNKEAAGIIYQDPAAADRWLAARTHIENTEWTSRFGGYFTGVYSKEFSDSEADLLELRDQINSLKYALNNEAAALVMKVDPNMRGRWESYRDDRYSTPEGLVADLYGSRRWTIDAEGRQLRGPERWDKIGQNIAAANQSKARYEKIRELQDLLNTRLDTLDVGAPWVEKEEFYKKYFDELAVMEAAPQYNQADRAWFVGWKPKRLVWEDLRNLYWRSVEQTKPLYDVLGQDYGEYMELLNEWTKGIAPMAALATMSFWNEFSKIDWIHPEMNSIEDLSDRLAVESTPDGYRQWILDQDTPIEAMGRMWTEKYWQEHWKATGDAEGLDFPIAQQEFFNYIASLNGDAPPMRGDVGPSQELLFSWVDEVYGEKWTEAELLEALGEKDILTADDRQQRSLEVEIGPKLAGMEERMWDAYNRIPPGHSDELLDEYLRLGGVYGESMLDLWRTSNGADAFRNEEEFEESLKTFEQAVNNLGWPEPSLNELYLRDEARDLNTEFRDFVAEELGEGFWKQRSYYFRLNSDEKDVYKAENPGFDNDMDWYNDARDAFAEAFPVWAAYYTDAGGAVGDRAIRPGDVTQGASARGPGTSAGAARGTLASLPDPVVPPGLRSGTTAEDVMRGRLGRGGTTGGFKWPKYLREILGGEAINELEREAKSGVKWSDLDTAIKDFINKVDENDDGRGIEKDTKDIYESIRRLGGGGGVNLAL